jgi:glycerol kinase
MALSVADSGGVYLVPAFVGLGAPYWNMYTRGTLVGLTRGSNRAHLVRAALESIAFQSADVLRAMTSDSLSPLSVLKADGGASVNNFLMQFQSDVLGVNVERPTATESTAMGAAFLAGLATGFWSGLDEVGRIRQVDRVFTPVISAQEQDRRLNSWKRAITSALSYQVQE